ncbi:hypothetical protein [Nitrosomonas sp.]|uniref:hypothetical protein n=1 Tax=Nitrosomonas sp. TaxID=42353 RepID=UPI0025FE7941|nr:hypothetical protein [Nitrosomonas sp.]MBV6448551.1 hypothetical protein [Nitrosomonas sp.]
MSELVPAAEQVLTPVGLDLGGRDLDWDTFVALGEPLCRAAKGANWWLGDWLGYALTRWPDRYEQAEAMTGLARQTLYDVKWVAESVGVSRRRETLEWSHHKEVAGLPDELADRWLDQAERSGWSVAELRAAVKRGAPELVDASATDTDSGEDEGEGVVELAALVTYTIVGPPDALSEIAEVAMSGANWLRSQVCPALDDSVSVDYKYRLR